MLKDPVYTAVDDARPLLTLFAWALHLKAAVSYQDIGRKKPIHFCLGGDPEHVISGAGAVKGRIEIPATGFGSP